MKSCFGMSFLFIFLYACTGSTGKTSFDSSFEIKIQNEAFGWETLKQYKGMDGLILFAGQYFGNDIKEAFDTVSKSLKEYDPKAHKKILSEDLDWQRFNGSLEQFQTLRRLYKAVSSNQFPANEFLSKAIAASGMHQGVVRQNMSAVLRAEGISGRSEKSKILNSLGLPGGRRPSKG